MKINTIASVIKSGGSIKLYRNFDEQYISNGYVCYAVSNLPRIETADQLCAILGIPSDKQGKYNIDIEAGLLPVFCRNEVDRTQFDDTPIERDDFMSLNWLGGEYAIFKSDRKVFFVQKAYLKPFSDYDELYYFDRINLKDGNHTIVIKAGMLLVGLAVSSHIIDENFAKRFKTISHLVQKYIDNNKYKERLEYTDEQQSFEFPETTHIIAYHTNK